MNAVHAWQWYVHVGKAMAFPWSLADLNQPVVSAD